MTVLNDNTALHRFEWDEQGHTAFASYRLADAQLVIPHVEAPVALRGTGAAGRLMEAIAAHAKERQLKVVPLCGYAAAWFRRHPEFADLLARSSITP